MENTTVPQSRRALAHFCSCIQGAAPPTPPLGVLGGPSAFPRWAQPIHQPGKPDLPVAIKGPQLLKNCTFACLHLKFGGIGISVIFSLSVWTWTAFPN